MDALMITTTCISLLSAIEQTSLVVSEFTRDAREACSNLEVVSEDLRSIRIVLKLFVEDVKDLLTEIFPQELNEQIIGVITICRAVVVQIRETLQKHEGDSISKATQSTMFGESGIANLQSDLEAHGTALKIAWEMVASTLVNAIRAHNQEILDDASEFKHEMKQNRTQILAKIARLQQQLPQDNDINNTSRVILDILNHYLDSLISFARTLYAPFDEDKSMNFVSVEQQRRSSLVSLPRKAEMITRGGNPEPRLIGSIQPERSSQDIRGKTVTYQNENTSPPTVFDSLRSDNSLSEAKTQALPNVTPNLSLTLLPSRPKAKPDPSHSLNPFLSSGPVHSSTGEAESAEPGSVEQATNSLNIQSRNFVGQAEQQGIGLKAPKAASNNNRMKNLEERTPIQARAKKTVGSHYQEIDTSEYSISRTRQRNLLKNRLRPGTRILLHKSDMHLFSNEPIDTIEKELDRILDLLKIIHEKSVTELYTRDCYIQGLANFHFSIAIYQNLSTRLLWRFVLQIERTVGGKEVFEAVFRNITTQVEESEGILVAKK